MMRMNGLGTFVLLLCTCVTVPAARTSAQIAPLDAGTISGSTYHNPELGFRYQFPKGWVVNDTATREKEIDAGHQVAWEDAATKPGNKAPSRCTKNLLFVTQHPAGMQVNSFDSSVFLMAVDPKCVPGVSFPTAINDHEATLRIVKQIVSRLKTSTVISKTPIRLGAFDKAGRVMLESSQVLNISLNERGGTTAQSIYSSLLLMQGGRYWVMWWFTSDTDYNLQKLLATKIFFDVEPAVSSEAK